MRRKDSHFGLSQWWDVINIKKKRGFLVSLFGLICDAIYKDPLEAEIVKDKWEDGLGYLPNWPKYFPKGNR